MKLHGCRFALACVATLGVAALGASGAAQANDVVWSVGVASPRHEVGAVHAPPVWHQRRVVVISQPPYPPAPTVLVQPQPVYYGAPQVVYPPPPYYFQSGWVPPWYRHGWAQRHHRRHGNWNDDRWERDDHRHGFDGGPADRGHR